MKQVLWNLLKLFWMICAIGGYGLYFMGTISAEEVMIWVVTLSLLLVAIYSFLSAYRLGPRISPDKFDPEKDVAEMNPNQWLYIIWVIQSVAIVIPAYSFSVVCVIVSVSLLAFGILIVCAITAAIGRSIAVKP